MEGSATQIQCICSRLYWSIRSPYTLHFHYSNGYDPILHTKHQIT